MYLYMCMCTCMYMCMCVYMYMDTYINLYMCLCIVLCYVCVASGLIFGPAERCEDGSVCHVWHAIVCVGYCNEVTFSNFNDVMRCRVVCHVVECRRRGA